MRGITVMYSYYFHVSLSLYSNSLLLLALSLYTDTLFTGKTQTLLVVPMSQ